MAVLGNRGTGLLEMAIEAFKDQSIPNQQLAPTVPGQNTVLRAPQTVQVAPRQQVATIQTNPELNQMPTMPLGQGVRATPQMMEQRTPSMDIGQGVLRPGADVSGMEKLAEDASKVVAEIQKNPQIEQDPGFMEQVKGYFGNRENMVRLAMAFNTMRLTPDQGLAAALGSELKDIRANRATNKTQTAVVNWLKANGYEQYVDVALQNPKAAVEIFKQITQKEFAPGKSPQVSGVQYDADNRAYVVVSENGQPTVKYLGTERDDPIETERLKGQWELSAKRSDEVAQKASTLETQLSQYQQAIQAIRSGAESGVIRNRLPAFDVQTATLRSIAQQLGIGVINSATFGALSEKELELALSTTMDLNLPPAQLEQQIIEKMKATEKLYLEMRRKAAEMASMPYSDYIKLQNERTQENEKFRKLPEGVDESLWYGMTLDEKRAYYEAGQ